MPPTKPKPQPATPKSVTTPKAATSVGSPKAKTKPAASKAKPKTPTAPKTKQKTQGSAPAPSPHRAPTRPNVSTKLSPELLGPVDKVKQALSAQSPQRPLNTIIEKLPTLPLINKLAVVAVRSVKRFPISLRSELLGEFGHSCSLLVHIVAEDNPDAISPILKMD
ncbi:hypothetical protein BLNAU_6320 [Blattamonas nauphoetae]|uniref:Uncharacterized protein n=1 Tax=Blattamonas nauphoetae TaxID=2049346 RepID=A0ABQ9Y4Z5_9EUKA|nr:hypothetical protein BLNAU_6320 [Blattamonas nauphoetae]